ncbi:helix-turn-helix domain-containing protein [Actinomycetospora straminea]|uniref:Helix-turn-helix domain-containing protein n=1 Tax=Actinomycetospora straminea TaxID=663607 RepID=A0ABP9F8A9_9PSEU|nr:helix-turn-helix domain-containing protein [Actinomycetospora straminea]MDD7936552.1 helix-turn-helix domain-containing protein [Actinomycetospora straminea]
MTLNEGTATAPTFYDVAEVAAMFKMSRMTVYRAINSGELRAIRIRGRLLIPAAVIDGLVAEATAERSDSDSSLLGMFGGGRR